MNPNQGDQMHPLLGKFDIDPGQWRPYFYGREVSVPVAAGGTSSVSLTINNQPFILTAIAHKIIGNTADPETSGLYQDGQYSIEFKDEQSNYQDRAISADLMWGNFGVDCSGSAIFKLPYPIPYAGNKTLTFNVTNRVARILTPSAEFFTLEICLHGVADWGSQRPQQY